MDKNGKIKGKVSIIDILVILLIVVVIVGIGARYGSRITSAVQSDKEFEYVLRVENVREYTVNALQRKGKIRIKSRKRTWVKLPTCASKTPRSIQRASRPLHLLCDDHRQG